MQQDSGKPPLTFPPLFAAILLLYHTFEGPPLPIPAGEEQYLTPSPSESNHTIHLDTRPVRDPTTKTTLPIPASKPHLASAIALEWDLLVSAAQALKTHHIPLTSLAARAREIDLDDQQRIESRLSARLSGSDAVGSNGGGRGGTVREEIVQVMMRYLDTDTLLCWAPLKSGPGEASGLENRTDNISARSETSKHSDSDRRNQSLRERQIRTAQPIIAYLTTYIWPGVSIKPVLEDAGSIIPAAQAPATRDVIRGWITGLRAWELAGLERAVLASKSLCVGARLAVEWSEEFEGVRREEVEGRGEEEEGVGKRFGVEEAARACSLEVEWQTGMWGEVEDTHDVEKEDLRRQLGSVVLVVSGTGRRGDTSEE